MSENKTALVQEIIGEVSLDLFKKWVEALPENSQTEDAIQNLAKSASESTIFVIKSFMEKINNTESNID